MNSTGDASSTARNKTIPLSIGPDLHTTTLENGLDVVVVPDHRLPMVNVGMAVQTGSTSESPETNGLAHLYEHMFFTANKSYPSGSEFEKRQRELGIVSNAFTSNEAVVYYFSLPKDNLQKGVAFMSDAMRKPLFKSEELKQERKVVLDEFNTRTSRPPRRLSRAVTSALFYKYPWRRSTLGEKDVIKNASRDDMMKFKEKFYRPGNSVVLVVGDTTPEQAISSVKEQFGDWSDSTSNGADANPPHPPLNKPKAVSIQADIQYASLLTKQFGPSVTEHPEATYAADVWGKLLSLSSSPFQENLVDNGPFQSASMSYYTQKHGPSIQFRGVFSPDQRDEALSAFLNEVQKFNQPGYFSEEQLEAARNKLIVERTFGVQNGRDFLQNLGFWWSVAGLDYYGSYLDNLRQVTLADVRTFCQKYVQSDNRVYGLLAPESENSISESALLDLVEKMKSSPTSTTNSDAPSADAGPHPGLRKKTNLNFEAPDSSGTSYFELSNGIPVIHRRVTENDVLSVQLFLDGGAMNYQKFPSGVEHFLLRTMLRGSETYPLEQFQAVTDREGVSLSTDSNYDYSRLSGASLREDLPLTLDLMKDAVQNPLLKEKQVEWVRRQMLTSVQQRRSNPREQVWHETNDVFFKNHPYQKNPEGTLESLNKIDRNTVRKYHDRLVRTGRMLLTVVGRLRTDRLKEELEKSFGSLESAAYERPAVPEFTTDRDQPVNITEQEDLSTAFIAAKYPLPSMTSPDYPALKLGLKLLSERIYEETRTKRGLTYGAYAGLPYYRRNWGYLFITTPRPNLAMSLIYREIHRIKQDEIDPEELNRTANVLYTRQLIERQTAGSIGSLLGRYELVGNGWETFGEILSKMRSLSPEQIQSVLQNHLKDYAFGVIQGKSMKQKINRKRLLNPARAREALKEKDNDEKNTPAPAER